MSIGKVNGHMQSIKLYFSCNCLIFGDKFDSRVNHDGFSEFLFKEAIPIKCFVSHFPNDPIS